MSNLPILCCTECGAELEEGRSGTCDTCLDDRGLTAEQLDCKYNPEGDGEHPEHTRICWRGEVENRDTLRGYWDWVASEIEQSLTD